MMKTCIARLTLAAFIAGLPGANDAFAAAVTRAKLAAPTGARTALPILAKPALLTAAPTLSAPNAAVPGLTAAPNVQVSLQHAVQTAAEAAKPQASAAVSHTQAGAAFDNVKPAANEGASVAGAVSMGAPALAKASAAPAPKTRAVPKSWSWKKKAVASGLIAAGISGVAYVLHAAGLPEAAAGLMPLIGMAGMLGRNGEIPDQVAQRFYTKLAERLQPGDAITSPVETALARELGLDKDDVDAVLLKLTDQNLVAAFNNGTYIFTDLRERAKSRNDDPSLAYADQQAYEGLKALNNSNIIQHARGVYLLNEANRAYRDARESNPQIYIIKNNGYLELIAGVMRMVDANLKKKEQTADVQQTRQQVKGALEWVARSHFSRGSTPKTLDAASHQWLMKMLGAVNTESIEGDDAVKGIKLLQAWAEGLGPETEKPQPQTKRLAAPAPAAKEPGFPVIRKGDKRVETLSQFGTNITEQALEGSLTPLIGRKAEIRQMVKTLLRVEKNNPIVIGEKGVGKTAVVNGLAQMIVKGEIPELKGKNIYQLNLTKIVAGTKYRGEFEERMQKIMDEVKASKGQIILFIDEIHRIVGAGSAEGANDASQILKDSLSTGEMAVIGATTMTEYRKIEKDGALARRFNPVKLVPPTAAEAIEIVTGIKARYEQKHGVSIPEETVKEAVSAAQRYITDRNLPDSVLDLIDDAAAEVELQASAGRADRQVTKNDIAFEISLRTGIPAGQLSADDMELLLSLPVELKKRLVGQDKAVDAVVRAIRRGRLGYRDPSKPVGAFALLGPTGVGKTHLVRVISRHLYRSDKNMVRIDMSEFKEKHTTSRLIGAPPGYVGFEGEGVFEKVRRNPHSVVLFDEVDKAHPEVLDLLLQILDDGFITDSQGRRIDFSHTVIFLTANTGGSLAGDAGPKKRRIGFVIDEPAKPAAQEAELDARAQGYVDAFKAATRPEFFNRIGKRNVVVFNELGRDHLAQILDIGVAELNERLKHKEMTIELSDAAKTRILDEAANEENRAYGARPLTQAMGNDVESALVDAELAKKIANGDTVVVDVEGDVFVAKKKQ